MLEHYLEILRKNILFRTMTDEEVLEAVECMEPMIRKYNKKEIIVKDGEFMWKMAVILSGRIHLFHIDSNGNSNLLEVLEKGDTIGMLNAVGKYRLHLSAVSTEKTDLLFLTVDSLLRKNVLTAPVQIRFLQNLTVALAQKAHRLTVKLEESIRRSTRERLQDYLSVQYHKSRSHTFSIPLNRQDLADFLFVDRSAMSSELCKMRDEGLLKFEKSHFELLVEMPITEEEEDPNEENG